MGFIVSFFETPSRSACRISTTLPVSERCCASAVEEHTSIVSRKKNRMQRVINILLLFRTVERRFKIATLILFAEDRNTYVAFWIHPHVIKKNVQASYSVLKVIVKGFIIHQQTK